MNIKKIKRYTHPIVSREVIADFISDQKTAIRLDSIATHFSYSKKRDIEALRKRVLAMIRDGEIKKEALVGLNSKFSSEVFEGSVEFGSDGIPVLLERASGETTNIHQRQLIKPVHGDQVIFVVERQRIGEEKPKGKIKKILSRLDKELVGQVKEVSKQLYFFSFDLKYPQKSLKKRSKTTIGFSFIFH